MKNLHKNAMGPIKAGTTILVEKPFVYILSSKERTFRCDYCLVKTKVLKCSGCQYVHYCGKVCQKEAWSDHKAECAGFRRVLPRVPPDAARLLAKIVRKLAHGGAHERGYYTETSFRVWKDLMSHYHDIKVDTRRMEHFACLCAILFQILSDVTLPNSAELMGIYGRMCINGFTILDPEMLSIGTGVYLGASVIDHSCEPNAVAVFDGTTINIRTLVDMPTLDWSKMFISYIDLLNTTVDRQTELQTAYYFLCQCRRCSDESKSSPMNTALCPNSNCNSSISISWRESDGALKSDKNNVNIDNHMSNGTSYHDNDVDSIFSNFNSLSLNNDKNYNNEDDDTCNIKCPSCEQMVDQEFVEKFREVMDFTDEQLQNMKNRSTTYVDICRKLLDKHEGVLHPMSLYHIQTLDLAMDGFLQYEFWDQALTYSKLLLPGFKKYYGERHPLYGLLYMKLGKLQLFTNKAREALESLKTAFDILKITHGEKHTLVKQVLIPLMREAQSCI